ncbi:MAG: NfeD family protein [Pseudomonadota bacterium]|nr:NfeD family protein [Pseudomonadota bacterium]
MEAITVFMEGLNPWHWWALAVLLVGLEVIMPSTYLLWPGISAAIIGMLVLIIPFAFGWQIQLLLFAVLTIVTTLVWQHWLKTHPLKTDKPLLNRRAAALIGRKVLVAEDFVGGTGPVHIDDTVWRARIADDNDPKADETLQITEVSGTMLIVRRVE